MSLHPNSHNKITSKMDAVPESETVKNKYPQTSSVWNYYKNVCREKRTAVCKYCDETLSYRGTISNLKKHVKRRHNIEMVPRNDDNVTDTDDDEKEEVMEETYLDEDIILETEEAHFDKRKALRSGVWTYFEVADEEQRLATCRLCREDYSFRTSSSNLAKHLKRRHSVDARTGEEESEGREEKSNRKSNNGKTSVAWDYFTIKDPTRRVAACKVCDVECSYYSSVSNLMKHVRRKHGMPVLTDDEQNDDEEMEATSSQSHHKSRSSVWLYFKKVDKKSGVAVCLICKKKLSYISTLTNLKRHLARKHPHVQLDTANEGKTMLIASDGQLYEIEDNPKQEILDIDDDVQDDDQSAEPLQQIYLNEIEGNVIEKSPKLPKKLKRIVMEDSNDTSDDEVTLKKRYIRTVHDSLDRFGKYLVSLLRQLPKEVSNQLQADFVKQIMNCQNNDVSYVATLKGNRQDDTVAVSSVCADEGYVQTTVVDNID